MQDPQTPAAEGPAFPDLRRPKNGREYLDGSDRADTVSYNKIHLFESAERVY